MRECADTNINLICIELVKMFDILEFKKFSDGRGDLVPIELGEEFKKSYIPFDVKRVYIISAPSKNKKATRGKHAHIDLEQVILCSHGSFVLDLEDANGNKESIFLKENNFGVHIQKGLIWRELKNFSPNCVVIVFASNHYNFSDYIRNYDDFKKKSNSL